MRIGLTAGALCLILASGAWAQVRGFPSTHASRLGKLIGGVVYPDRGMTRPRHHVPVVYPVAVPAYFGGYRYGPRPILPPQVRVVYPPPPPSPPVIINNYYNPPPARPVIREYTAGSEEQSDSGAMKSFQAPLPPRQEPPAEDGKATIYLIAYKDHSIYPVLRYWIEGGTLHYITTQGSHNRAPVELIDQRFSEQLNLERGLDFALAIPE